MALADLSIAADAWIKSEFERPDGQGTRLLRRIAGDVETAARAAVPRDTGATADSIEAEERHGKDGIIWFKVQAANPVTDVLNSASGFIRNRGAASGELTRTGRHKRARGTGKTIRKSEPFMRTAAEVVYKAGF